MPACTAAVVHPDQGMHSDRSDFQVIGLQGPVFELVFSGGTCTQDPDTGKQTLHLMLSWLQLPPAFRWPTFHP